MTDAVPGPGSKSTVWSKPPRTTTPAAPAATTDRQWDSRALLSLVLVGLPELSDRLALRRNRSLYSRIHRRFVVTPLTPDDTTEYIRVRLRKAGCDKELFTSDAVAMLHEAANGSLRDLDRLATATLRDTARKKRKLVERDVLARVIELESREAA